MSETCERDFYAWANEQATLLRTGRLTEADIAHIAEEIESMGMPEKRELVSRLTVLLLHRLKWQFQPGLRGASSEATIKVLRNALDDHLDDNPSLRALLPQAIGQAYQDAVIEAEAETGFKATSFPAPCPWSFAQIMDRSFWPG
jgi:hypothetical protein